ncbi:AraC family transcriptional regulator [Dactylosporangium sp. AC04546]|uniref:helix-turn-helix transcriptional regulator n=1 Tax=Dactylosporangium sp. AC04546 TaxID=2862460 RepID=UPI001EDF50BD|nr:AraC family transcriptional regulator [Dactylosporangium sp. AC04546]WVK86008.1 AraC family transcriptional regulator [Dactylosporangium sp. AC04546]
MTAELVTAWRPTVPGVTEVFHAHFVDHAYPLHVHDAWTLLIVDDGAIRFDLDRHPRGAAGATYVSILPPNVPHDGRAATDHGFRKRVVYLEPDVLDPHLAGAAVDHPGFDDPLLRRRIHQLHEALRPGDDLEAESRLALIRGRLQAHLDRHFSDLAVPLPRRLAEGLRDLLDARTAEGITLREAGSLLDSHPGHLVRAFTATFGLPPHQYLVSRRIEHARHLLLSGVRPAEAAALAGFHDQAHLHRHFKRHLGVTPGAYAAQGGVPITAPSAP